MLRPDGGSAAASPDRAWCPGQGAPSRTAWALGRLAGPRPVRRADDSAVGRPQSAFPLGAWLRPLAGPRTAPEPAGHRSVGLAPAAALSVESDWGRDAAAALARRARLPAAQRPAACLQRCVRLRTPAPDHEGCRWAAVRSGVCPESYHSLSSSSTSLLAAAEPATGSGRTSSWSSIDPASSSTGVSGSS